MRPARTLSQLRNTFSAHADGIVTLPTDLLALQAGIQRLTDEATAPIPSAASAENAYLTAVVDAACTGARKLPDVAQLLEQERAAAVAERRGQILREAVERADHRLGAYVRDYGDDVITEHLAPAVDAVWLEVKACVAKLPDGDLDAERILRAGPDAREAWLDLSGLVGRYQRIRDAAAPLRRLEQPQRDTRGDFGELRNFDELTAGYHIQVAGPRPWPTEAGQTTARLVWYARHGADVWLPTVAQQDQRHLSAYPDKQQAFQPVLRAA